MPPADGTLAVNFGQLLERWTGGLVQATRHQVIAPKRLRFSIPFFDEPRVDARIAPLPITDTGGFTPLPYGGYLWEAATNFVERARVRHLRAPRQGFLMQSWTPDRACDPDYDSPSKIDVTMTPFFTLPEDLVWTATAPGVRRAVMLDGPELMLVAFSFDAGAVGALHSHPHVQASYVAEGLFDVTVDGVTTRLGKGAGFIVSPDLVHGVVAITDGVLADSFTPRRDDFT